VYNMPSYKEKICSVCNNEYKPTSPKQKSCPNEKCKVTIRREAEKVRYYKNRKKTSKRCHSCGDLFETVSSVKIYCGSVVCEKERIRVKNIRSEQIRGSRTEYHKLHYSSRKNEILQYKKKYYRDVVKAGKNVKDGWSTVQPTFDEVKKVFEAEDYKVLSSTYINNREKLDVICPEGHQWKTSFHSFKDLTERCMKCYLKNSWDSKPQQEIFEFVKEVVGKNVEVIKNDRDIISPKELDIYIPSKNLAIEYCGLHWHAEVASGKPRKYHYDKMMECYGKNIRLITIFEDEYLNRKDVVLSRIRNALNGSSRRVYARKCEVREIAGKVASEFLARYHLQGKSGSSIRFGLFYGEELLQVMTFGELSRPHAKMKSGRTAELKRFSCLPDISVVGGASKIFKQALKYLEAVGYKYVKSYCDMRYANIFSPVYEKMGFKLLTGTKYTPHYVKDQKRYRNQGLRKTPEERLTGKTEFELRKDQGYDRLWDCGHRTYLYEM
jgi:hypothetical protein